MREMTVRTDMARGIKAITEKRIHLGGTNGMYVYYQASSLSTLITVTDLLTAYVALFSRRPLSWEARRAKPVTSGGLFLIGLPS